MEGMVSVTDTLIQVVPVLCYVGVSAHIYEMNMIPGSTNVNERYDERFRQGQHTSATGATSITDAFPGISCLGHAIRAQAGGLDMPCVLAKVQHGGNFGLSINLT